MLFGILMRFGLGGGVATSKTLAGFGVSLYALRLETHVGSGERRRRPYFYGSWPP